MFNVFCTGLYKVPYPPEDDFVVKILGRSSNWGIRRAFKFDGKIYLHYTTLIREAAKKTNGSAIKVLPLPHSSLMVVGNLKKF